MDAHAARLAVFASGRGSNLQAILDHLDGPAGAAAHVALVVSDKAMAGALDLARGRDIPAQHVHHTEVTVLQRLLADLHIDLIALAGYLKFVPTELTRAWRGRLLNVHPAPPPVVRRQGDVRPSCTRRRPRGRRARERTHGAFRGRGLRPGTDHRPAPRAGLPPI